MLQSHGDVLVDTSNQWYESLGGKLSVTRITDKTWQRLQTRMIYSIDNCRNTEAEKHAQCRIRRMHQTCLALGGMDSTGSA